MDRRSFLRAGALFSVATGIGAEQASRDLEIAMVISNNGQAITLGREFEAAGYGDLDAAKEALASAGTPQLAMTFRGGTHDAWLRYWLLATGTKLDKVDLLTAEELAAGEAA